MALTDGINERLKKIGVELEELNKRRQNLREASSEARLMHQDRLAEIRKTINSITTEQYGVKEIDTELKELDQEFGGLAAEREERLNEVDEQTKVIDSEIEELQEEVQKLQMIGAILAKADEVKELIAIVATVKPEIMSSAGEVADLLREIISEFIKLGLTQADSMREELGPEMEKFSERRAKNLRRDYDNLRDVNFSEEQAMQIILSKMSSGSSLPMSASNNSIKLFSLT